MMKATTLKMSQDMALTILDDGTLIQMTTTYNETNILLWPQAITSPCRSFEELIAQAGKKEPLTGHMQAPLTDPGEDVRWFIPGTSAIQIDTIESPGQDELDLLAHNFRPIPPATCQTVANQAAHA